MVVVVVVVVTNFVVVDIVVTGTQKIVVVVVVVVGLYYCNMLTMLKLCTLVNLWSCLLYTSPSPRDATLSRMPSSA